LQQEEKHGKQRNDHAKCINSGFGKNFYQLSLFALAQFLICIIVDSSRGEHEKKQLNYTYKQAVHKNNK
jgi:hypothetical protein